MALHAFVAMPFGTKEGIDFNTVYGQYIKPALEGAGFEVFRADEELRAGNIRTDMFQELLLADLVVVDLSIDNPNVWYELGIRHALRSRGVIQIQCKRDYLPFDVYVDRTLCYHVNGGVPDPAYLETDKQALASFATETMSSWHGRKISPVYHLLPFLKEPDWKSLRTKEASEFWEAQEDWEARIKLARMHGRPSDILVLALEVPTRVLRLEAHRAAASALLNLGQFTFALAQNDRARRIDPDDLKSRQQRGLLLSRLKKHEAAEDWLKEILKDHPDDAESWALLGRVEKEAWTDAWRSDRKTPEQNREDAAYEEGLLCEAINAYQEGFRKDPSHAYSGINALTLRHLLRDLTGKDDNTVGLEVLEGGVRWAIQCELTENPGAYWARVTLGDLELLSGSIGQVEQVYRRAVAVAEKNWFALDSTRQQLLLLKALDFRPQEVEAALKIFDRELSKLEALEALRKPRQVFLFSGHMIDRPGRAEPRFPADKEAIAAAAIAAKLDELGAGPEDVAVCGGACGGDLLFAEACLERGLHLDVRIPSDEPTFLQESVSFAGERWRDRFFAVRDHPNARVLSMPEELGPPPEGASPYARNNRWLVYAALARGPRKVRFICLWDRKEGEGPGGTKHMHDIVLKYSGQVHVLDTNELW